MWCLSEPAGRQDHVGAASRRALHGGARPVAAFDLSMRRPGLADYLTRHVTIPSIQDTRGQVRFFDGLIETAKIPKIIDLSHREFANFFTIVDKIGLFKEAQRRAIEPLILFLIDPSPIAAKAYSLLRRRFAGISLLPVRNLTVPKACPIAPPFPHASRLVVSLELQCSDLPQEPSSNARNSSFLNLAKAGFALFRYVGPHACRA